ncbi:MAG TPA: hypothetical protein VH596_12185 [Terriglobales bacterium]|jgi:hypothetical protein
MVLGLSLHTYTVIHVLISLTAIASGFIVMSGFFHSKRMNGWNGLFLTTTVLTSLTGFGFPFSGVTPAIKLGIISLVVLAIAIIVRYPLHLAWRKTYVISASLALYFNVFVLVVQSFEKVPALRALAPTQKEAPFAVAQLLVLTIFIVATVVAVRRFRSEPAVKSFVKAA